MKKHLFEHSYPAWLWRHPQWIALFHAWHALTLQRNLITGRWLRRLIPGLAPGALVLDAGCGSGQHLFSVGRKMRHLRFLGVDKNPGNIAFCERRAAALPEGAHRLRFICSSLEAMEQEDEVDLLLCIATLPYIIQDQLVLERFYRALKINGQMLVYVPVHGRIVLPFYRYFLSRTRHYENTQQRQRIYTPEEISGKLAKAGFEVQGHYFTYGTLGIIGHEWYSLFLVALGNPGTMAGLLLPLWAVLLPLALLLVWVDDHLPKKTGNGLLLLAVKPGR